MTAARTVEAWVATAGPVLRFLTEAVARDTGLPPAVVHAHLVVLAQAGRLALMGEIFCPDCDRTVVRVEAAGPLPAESQCDWCGLVFSPRLDDSVLWFRRPTE